MNLLKYFFVRDFYTNLLDIFYKHLLITKINNFYFTIFLTIIQYL